QRGCDAGGRLAVVAGDELVVLRAHLHPGDVAQLEHRAVRVGPHDDVAELLRRLQPRLRGDRGVDLLAFDGWRRAQRADRDLRVLGLDRRGDVARCEAVGVEFVWVQPDPHRVLGTEYLQV